jgi:nucleoside-diphosphate-sugar epimerase
LEAARQFHVPKVIYGSSISVYGTLFTQHINDSQLLKAPPAPEGVYGTAKRYVELVGEIYQQQFGIQFVALRIASVIGMGVTSPTSLWRSDIFEKLKSTDDVKITIPYQPGEALPLVYVEDVAEMIKCLVEARHIPLTVYNTPAETWTMQALAEYITSLAPNIRFCFGESKSGNPTVISGQQFIIDFGYAPAMSIKDRLRTC